MTKIMSFTKIENELLPKFRENMNLAESTEDVKKFFCYTVQDFLEKVTEGQIKTRYDDVTLAPEGAEGFAIAPSLLSQPAFKQTSTGSDLQAILKRFAQTAVKRYKRLEKSPDKTELKIYHGTGSAAR